MGISHPLSDEYDALRGAVLSPDTTPPSSPLAHHHLLVEHEVTRMDTLAGIAIKYGVEVRYSPFFFIDRPISRLPSFFLFPSLPLLFLMSLVGGGG